MAAEEDEPATWEEDSDALFWAHEFHRRGMLYAQALTLAYMPGVDRHAVREALERGCRPELAFLIFG